MSTLWTPTSAKLSGTSTNGNGWRPPVTASQLQDIERRMYGMEWRAITSGALDAMTLAGIQRARELARAMHLKNPMIRHGVEVTSWYVWGRGVKLNARDDAVGEILERNVERNAGTLYGMQASMQLEEDLEVDGEVFIAMPSDPQDGTLHLRQIPATEIEEVETDPEDYTVPMFYRRRKTKGRPEQWYPDYRWRPRARPATHRRIPIRWQDPVLHVSHKKVSPGKIHPPEILPALDWARAYGEYLSDWAEYVRSMARIAWMASGPVATDEIIKALGIPVTDDEQGNPFEPRAGGVAATDEDTQMTRLAAVPDASAGRPIRLMIAAAFHLPDSIMSCDPDQGSRATATTLDRPTELRMVARQSLWNDALMAVGEYMLVRAVQTRNLSGTIKPSDRGPWEIDFPSTIDPAIEITWPPVLEGGLERIQMIIAAATLEGKERATDIMDRETLIRLLASELDVEAEQIMEALDKDDTTTAAAAARAIRSIMQRQAA